MTGTKLDLEGIYQVARSAEVKLLVDGAQGAGAMEIDMEKTPFDFLALTGHKHLFGPQGTGALIIRKPDELASFLRGGTGSLSEKTVHPDFPPDKFEAGTLNTPGYAGLTAGIRFLMKKGIENIIAEEHYLTSISLINFYRWKKLKYMLLMLTGLLPSHSISGEQQHQMYLTILIQNGGYM